MAIPQKRKRRQQGLRLLALLVGRTASVPVPQPHPQQVQRNVTAAPRTGRRRSPAGDSGKAPSREESGESGDRNPADVAYGREVPSTLSVMGRSVRAVRYETRCGTRHPIMAMTKKSPRTRYSGERVRHIPHAVRAGDQAQRTKPNRCEQPRAQARQRAQQGRNRQDDPASFSCAPKAMIMNDSKMGTLSWQSVHDHENLQQCGGPVRKNACRALSVGIPSPFSESHTVREAMLTTGPDQRRAGPEASLTEAAHYNADRWMSTAPFELRGKEAGRQMPDPRMPRGIREWETDARIWERRDESLYFGTGVNPTDTAGQRRPRADPFSTNRLFRSLRLPSWQEAR